MLRQQFDIIDSQCDFAKYQLLVLPDTIPVDPVLEAKLSAFVAGGGKIIATYHSGLEPLGTGFGLKELGVAAEFGRRRGETGGAGPAGLRSGEESFTGEDRPPQCP